MKVTDKNNKLCLYANLMVNFSVSYEVAADKVSPWFSNSNHKMFSFDTHVVSLVIQKLFCQFRSFQPHGYQSPVETNVISEMARFFLLTKQIESCYSAFLSFQVHILQLCCPILSQVRAIQSYMYVCDLKKLPVFNLYLYGFYVET